MDFKTLRADHAAVGSTGKTAATSFLGTGVCLCVCPLTSKTLLSGVVINLWQVIGRHVEGPHWETSSFKRQTCMLQHTQEIPWAAPRLAACFCTEGRALSPAEILKPEYLRAGFGPVCFACLASQKRALAAESRRGVVPTDRC